MIYQYLQKIDKNAMDTLFEIPPQPTPPKATSQPLTPETLLKAGWKLTEDNINYTAYVKDIGCDIGSFLSIMYWKTTPSHVTINVNVDEGDGYNPQRMVVNLYRHITVEEFNILISIHGLVEYTIGFPKSKSSVQPKTCRSCEFRERWQCGGSIIQYCGKRHSSRTSNGLLKIKVTNTACSLYREQKNE